MYHISNKGGVKSVEGGILQSLVLVCNDLFTLIFLFPYSELILFVYKIINGHFRKS